MTRTHETAPYGSWPSPIDAADVARGEALVEWLGFVGDEVWWTEARPEENGRSALMRHTPEGIEEALPGWDVRTRVIEYGGRPWQAVSGRAEDGIVFTHATDQRVYRYRPGSEPFPLSPVGSWPAELRYSDFSVRGHEVWCMREAATGPQATGAVRHLVALPLDGSAADASSRVRELAATHHFMTGPRLEPGGDRVVWIGWNHPAMPWDTTEVMAATVTVDGALTEPTVVAGDGRQAITQIEWAADGSGALYAVTDPNGWWNVHEILPDGGLRNLLPLEEEFGDALWRIGLRWCLPLHDGGLAVLHGVGERRLGVLTRDGQLTDFPGEATEWSHPATDGRQIAAVAAGPRMRRTVVLADPADHGIEVLRPPSDTSCDAWVSTPYRRTWRGPEGERVHAHVHPPHNPEVAAPKGELPPWVVFVHGGPSSRSHLVPNHEITYVTSRGIGVLDVQYGGSTGYGRAYRERLRESWGVTDVRDCATAVRGLVTDGLAAADRIAIRGGSAGGWTAAASLGTQPDLYQAAGIYYPVLDLVSWRTQGTHDFESRYSDGLIGPWPEAEDRYARRSPVAAAARIRTPFVLFQGLADTVCPPAQAEALLALIEESGPEHRYLAFEGEGHGFRRCDTISASLHAELELYGRTLGFAPKP